MGGTMQTKIFIVGLIILFLVPLSPSVQAAGPDQLISDAVAVLEEMATQPDAGSLSYLLERAEGVAIFPSVIKAGLMLGGRYGEGFVLRYDSESERWYGPYFVEIKGLSYGLQFGVQSTSLVLVITNKQGIESFKGDKVTLGGDLSIAAGPMGRRAEAATDLDLKASIYSYSMSKGIFAGMSLEGAVISAHDKNNESYWGELMSADEMLDTPAKGSRIRRLTEELSALAN
jgi:lipid-binding SYLF domain-containing protein